MNLLRPRSLSALVLLGLAIIAVPLVAALVTAGVQMRRLSETSERIVADGVVATVVDMFPDQPIGSVDVRHPAGNHVALRIGEDRFVVFGHMQSASVRVSVGDQVRRGDVIGLVGNSGNSDEPHLHIQAQNNATFDVFAPPANLTTYPLLFDDMVVRRNGAVQHPDLADLRRGDTFRPVG